MQDELVGEILWVQWMIQDELVDGAEWVGGRHRLGLGMIYHDFVDEEDWVYGDTGRRCGHYEVGLWMRQGCFGGLSRVCL